jgi:hypothetical protein
MKILFAVRPADVQKVDAAVRRLVELLSRSPSKAGERERREVRIAVEAVAHRQLGVADSEWDEVQAGLRATSRGGRTLSAQIHLTPTDAGHLAKALAKLESATQARALEAFLEGAAEAGSHVVMLAN